MNERIMAAFDDELEKIALFGMVAKSGTRAAAATATKMHARQLALKRLSRAGVKTPGVNPLAAAKARTAIVRPPAVRRTMYAGRTL
jgi:hypothetical protein